MIMPYNLEICLANVQTFSQAFVAAAAGAAGATPALAPALGGVPGLFPAPVTANFCFFSAGLSICKRQTVSKHNWQTQLAKRNEGTSPKLTMMQCHVVLYAAPCMQATAYLTVWQQNTEERKHCLSLPSMEALVWKRVAQ